MMEDSGVDSGDVLTFDDETNTRKLIGTTNIKEYSEVPQIEMNGTRQYKSAQQLQKEIVKRIERARRNHSSNTNSGIAVEHQPRKGLIPMSRLNVPGKGPLPNPSDGADQPLVTWISDSSEDEYDFHTSVTSRTFADKDISNQLRKDGFNLDLTPDDEDLDLIPPRPMKPSYYACCQLSTIGCSIQ